jgi:hypothetical protein
MPLARDGRRACSIRFWAVAPVVATYTTQAAPPSTR